MAISTEQSTLPVEAGAPSAETGRWRLVGVPARRHPAERLAIALGLAGVVYRLILLRYEVPQTNSDEAITGLVALHLTQGRAAPLFFYGQHYMGALEAYLAAPVFAVLGSSVFALRLPNLLLYGAFLVLMWRLTRRLYTPWLAAATVGALALGADRIVKNQVVSGGGYPEMNPAGALLVLLAVNVGLGTVRHRWLAYGGWGLVAGLTLWDDWLILPYVAVAGVLLLAVGGRHLWGRAGLALGAGLLLGLVPIVAYNLTAAPENRSLAVYAKLTGGASLPWAERLHGGLLLGLPLGTGFGAPDRYEPWQHWWAVAYPILLVVAGLLAVVALCRVTRPERVRQAGRLALVAGAALSLTAYARSSAAGTFPIESSRYLSCLLISTPAVLWPLWAAASRARRSPSRFAVLNRLTAVARFASLATLAAVGVTMASATGQLIGHAPALAQFAEHRRDLVASLDRLGITRFYSEYWTCNTVTFSTRERLICAVLGEDLYPGYDRYPPYRAAVDQAERPAYVLPTGSMLSARVAAHLAASGVTVTVTRTARYDIYQTSGPVDLPLK